MPHKPSWFRGGQVYVSYAPTVGINKDGDDLFVVDPKTGIRTDVIDDTLEADVMSLTHSGVTTDTSSWIPDSALTDRLVAVPTYYDRRPGAAFEDLMGQPDMGAFDSESLGSLLAEGKIIGLNGHGSPSADMRRGEVPYIKVSDIRAGQININPTNRVPEVVAERFWKGPDSGLLPYDLITPVRTSKNIGEFAVIMPGQERVVLTKEVLVLRAGEHAGFDNFYLLWALTLKAVRRQWDRIVFMQTNREDVGNRYREILIPVPKDSEVSEKVSKSFRDFYLGTQRLREDFMKYLSEDDRHHIFMSTSIRGDDETADFEAEVTDEGAAMS